MYVALQSVSKTSSQPCQTSNMGHFAEIVKGSEPFTVFPKPAILEVWQDSEYASAYLVPIMALDRTT